jgi:hypothetical protein
MKKQPKPKNKKLLSLKSGTAISSPHKKTLSQANKIFETLWNIEKNAHVETTINATGKRLRYLERNYNLDNPEQVKRFIATKQCSNANKECLTSTHKPCARAIYLTIT